MSSYGAVATISSGRGLAINRPKRPRKYKEETSMKRSLKQRFKDWLFDESPPDSNYISVDEDSVQLSRDKSIRFEIHAANGGRIVQTRRYDSQKDRHIENLYIITSDMEFGREIDKIITMEALR